MARKAALTHLQRARVAARSGVYPTGNYEDVFCYWCGGPGKLGWTAAYTGKGVGYATGWGIDFDHIIPESLGGTGGADNLVLACTKCNRGRNNRPLPPGWEA